MNDFIKMLIQFFTGVLIVIFISSISDTFFNLSDNLTFKSALGLNMIFAIGSSIIMFATIFILLILDMRLPFLKSDTAVLVFGLSICSIMLFAIKAYLVYRYALNFPFHYLIIAINALLMMTPFYAVYILIKTLGNAFSNH